MIGERNPEPQRATKSSSLGLQMPTSTFQIVEERQNTLEPSAIKERVVAEAEHSLE